MQMGETRRRHAALRELRDRGKEIFAAFGDENRKKLEQAVTNRKTDDSRPSLRPRRSRI